MGEREERIVRNEALFRSVNERVRELAATFAGSDPEHAAFVCECGQADCAGSLTLTLVEYERVRADPTHFVVVPGHVAPEVERVIERREGYEIVRKHDDEARIAIQTDPRS